jgi:hypothetical protein
VPTLSIPEVYEAYALARSHGYTNVLTGEFAELTYGKYPHALSHLLFRGRWLTLWRMIQSEHRRTRGSRRELVQDALSGFVPGKVANRRLVARGQNSAEQIPSWTKPGVLDADLPRPDLMPPGWDRYRTLQMWGFEGCTVTMDADATCAAIAGVTVRRPFADVDLWEFFMSLRAEVKFPTMEWKSLARRAMQQADERAAGDYVVVRTLEHRSHRLQLMDVAQQCRRGENTVRFGKHRVASRRIRGEVCIRRDLEWHSLIA